MEIEKILELAGTSLSKLCIMGHHQGYQHLIVRIEDGVITDASIFETVDGYYRSEDGEWHSIIKVGTGSCPCNCDACQDGEDPADWADNDDAPVRMEDEIRAGIDDMILCGALNG
jgi:hypothetical protein